jgi:hypothetical protein
MPERLRILESALGGIDDWVLSGSLDGWGDPIIPFFATVIFLQTATEVRLRRLHEREAQRFGAESIQPGGPFYDHHREFLDWAASYDTGTIDIRCRQRHEAWLARVDCPVIVARGEIGTEQLTRDILNKIEG